MTFEYQIFPEKRCIVQCFTGEVSLEDVMRCCQEMWADARYDRSYDGISDLRQCTTKAVPADVAALVGFLRNPQTSVGRWATIFSDPKSTALTMLVRRAIRPWMWIEVFSSWEGACRGLGVDVPQQGWKEVAK